MSMVTMETCIFVVSFARGLGFGSQRNRLRLELDQLGNAP